VGGGDLNYIMTYSKKIIICFLITFLISFSFFSLAQAQEGIKKAQKGLLETAGKADLTPSSGSTPEPQDIIVDLVSYLMAFTGIILLVNILLGGYQWMTSNGNEEKITKAKQKIIHSTIGMAIIMLAYLLVSLIFERFSAIL